MEGVARWRRGGKIGCRQRLATCEREREVEIEREEKERFIERERYVRGERNKIKN